MPHMDGWAVLSALKGDSDTADIPVVMETIVQEKGLAFSLGAADYLTKPIQWARLKRVLDRYRSATPQARVVVVDDDDSTQEVRDLLESEGWSVVEVRDTPQLLAELAKDRPALVLVDVNMSETNGFALIKELRKDAQWRDLPVIALTARNLSPEQSRRLEGRVQQIVNTEEEAPEALLAVLRDIAPDAPRAGTQEGKADHGDHIAG